MGVVSIYHIKSTVLEQKRFDLGSLSPSVITTVVIIYVVYHSSETPLQ